MKNEKITLKQKIKNKIIRWVLNSYELNEMKEDLEDLQRKVSNLKDDIDFNNDNLDEYELEELKDRVDTLETDYTETNDKVEDLEYRIDCLEDDLNDTTSRVDEYELTTREETPSNIEFAKGEVINALENLLNALKGGF